MHAFDRDIGFVQESDGVHNVTMSDQWSINNIPNGGYTMALLTQGMLSQSMLAGDTDLVSCITTANYMDRCDPRPAQILLETISESRNFIRKQARLVQDGKERIRAMGTFIKFTDQSLPQHYEKGPEKMAGPDQCLKVPSMGGGYSLFDQVDMRLDPECAGWTTGKLTDRSVQKGWIRFKENRKVDVPAITFFADCFPPCIFTSHGMVAWVPTIEYSVNVRQLPKPGWLRGIFTTRFISSGLVEEDGELWDQDNSLIAISRQIAKYHPPVN
ncbi:MAG: thioesterase family protein [Desulfobacteraceae bacterium]|nr:thioesterase family protein [Desulfobacteraceae bacterium]